ncbi:MAG: CPBP family intramembrane glutamic endopeptidase [Anaerolineales bacterium]
MESRSTFAKRRPILSYLLLAISVSWAAILLVIGPAGFLGTEEIPESVMTLVYMATLLGPSISGLLLTGLVDGRAGFRQLGGRLGVWRVGAGWYFLAVLSAPVAIGLALLILGTTSTAFVPSIFRAANRVGLLVAGLFGGLMVGVFEELGWTGFAVPRLLRRHGVVATGVIVGVVWGAWHGPLFLGAARASTAIPPVLMLAILLFSFLPAFRVLMVWVYERTGSLPVTILMHWSLTSSTLILQPQASGMEVVLYDLVFAALLWVLAAVLTSRRAVAAPAPARAADREPTLRARDT